MTQTLGIVILSAAVAAAAGVGTHLALGAGPRSGANAAGDPTAASLERLSDELAGLAERQRTLESSLARLETSGAESELVAPGPTRVSQSDIEAAVASYLGRSGLGAVEAAAEAPAVVPMEDRVSAAMAELAAEGLSDLDRQALWRRYAEEGLSDEIVAAYEALAERSPNDPESHVELAGAYLNKIFEVGNSPEAGLWATKADRAFDRALELDDRHWEARFSKAVSLSFWPPVFGKQGEAIKQFETLVQQQAGLPPQDNFAQTHLLLGNMYRQIGEEQQAAAAWERGLEMFPDNAELMGQLEVFSSGE